MDDDLRNLIERLRNTAAECDLAHPLDLNGPAIATLREAALALVDLDHELALQ